MLRFDPRTRLAGAVLSAFLSVPCACGATPVAGAPTLVQPNGAVNSPNVFATPRIVADGYALSSMYFDAAGNGVWLQPGAVYSTSPASQQLGPAEARSWSSAAAGAFDARVSQATQTDGSVNQHSYASSQVWNWFVLAGAPGSVTLTADIAYQGRTFANNAPGGNAGSIFGVSLGVLTAPSDLTQDYVISLSGAVNWSGGFSRANTHDVESLWATGVDEHVLNYVLRSEPFTVTVGVPFRVSMIVSAEGFAGPGGAGSSWSDFTDPSFAFADLFPGTAGLSPSGFFAVGANGDAVPLDQAGLGLARVPGPTPLALLAIGLVALGAVVRLPARARRGVRAV